MSDQIPQAPPPPASPYVAPTAVAGPKQALSLTSFILGLAGLVFSWVPVLGFLASLAAIVLGFLGKSKEPAAPKWMWLVGIITGFVAIVLSILFIVLIIILPLIALSTVGGSLSNLPGY
ncbi:MAG: hypothetical protein ABI400_09945 [Lacisediminihabitans sp.]